MATAGSVPVRFSTISSSPPREEKSSSLAVVLPTGGATAGAFPAADAAATAARIVSQMAGCKPHLKVLSELFGEKVFKELGKLTVEQVCTLALIHCMTRVVQKGGEVNEKHSKVLLPFLRKVEEKQWGNVGTLIYTVTLLVKNQEVKAEYEALAPALQAIDALLALDMRTTLLKDCTETTDSQERGVEFCAHVHQAWACMIHPLLAYLTKQIETSQALHYQDVPVKNKKIDDFHDLHSQVRKGMKILHCISYFLGASYPRVVEHNKTIQVFYKCKTKASYFETHLTNLLETALSLGERKLAASVACLNEHILQQQVDNGTPVQDARARMILTSYLRKYADLRVDYFTDLISEMKKVNVKKCDVFVDQMDVAGIFLFLFESKEVDQHLHTRYRVLFESLKQTQVTLQARNEKLERDMRGVREQFFQTLQPIALQVFGKNAQESEYVNTLELQSKLYGTWCMVNVPNSPTMPLSQVFSSFVMFLSRFYTEQIAAMECDFSPIVDQRLMEKRAVIQREAQASGLTLLTSRPDDVLALQQKKILEEVALRERMEELQTCHTPISRFFHGLFKTLFALPSLSEEELLNDPLFFTEKRSRPQTAEKVTIAIKLSEGAAAAIKESVEESGKAAAVATAAAAVRVEQPLLISSLLFGPREARDLSYHLNHVQWSLEWMKGASVRPSAFRVLVPALIHHLYLAMEIHLTSQLREEEDYALFHGIVALMRALGLTRHQNRAWQINYGTFWFRFPNQSLNNYPQRPPRLLQLMSDAKKEGIAREAIQIELEKAVTSLLPIISENLHIGMVKAAVIPNAPPAQNLQNLAADFNGCEENFKKLFVSKNVIIALAVLQDAFDHFMQLKEQINMLFDSQRYLSMFVDNTLTFSYLTVKLMGTVLAVQRGLSLHLIHNIEQHWDDLQLEGKIEGVKKEHFIELNLQKAGDYPTTVREFMAAYEFSCAATTGVEGEVPAGYSEKLDLYQRFNASLGRRIRTVLAYTAYVLKQLS